MINDGSPYPTAPMLTSEAARWLKLSGRTLEKHRCRGTGPLYRKIGGRVVYDFADLRSWLDAGTRRRTFDPGSEP